MAQASLERRMSAYQATAIFSVIFALIGFSYNVWRMEISEQNNTIRTAAFEVVKELAELEQLVYAAHYDADTVRGNPRVGWVKVGLVQELSMLIGPQVESQAALLHSTWTQRWQQMSVDTQAVNEIVASIDKTRAAIRSTIVNLE
ncbi:hypothetical protein [Neptunomonas sp. XY-337]|uniref:hypothetical protein n=1 Tax=Neptunomonas sp. XY-337 TaxID=2561897 RepID=UPI0010AA463B|nr:hypothetical protein [Neptunomonas sp. XY-337]